MTESAWHGDVASLCSYANRQLGMFFAFRPPEAGQPAKFAWNNSRTIGCFISGDAFTASSDPQLHLIGLYEERGLAALKELNGWFSGLLIDLERRQAILFNDRYGVGRIYVREEDSGILFSSQAKSLLAALPKLRKLDGRSLGEWLSCGCVLNNRSLFCGVSLLPPGSAWIFSANGVLKKKRGPLYRYAHYRQLLPEPVHNLLCQERSCLKPTRKPLSCKRFTATLRRQRTVRSCRNE